MLRVSKPGVYLLRKLAVCVLLTCTLALAEEPGVVVEKAKDHFETGFAQDGQLKLEVRSGDVRISGTESNKISIRYSGRNSNDIGDVVVRCKKTGNSAELNVSGGPRNEFQISIEIPRNTELHVRMPFGELTIQKVRGGKDVSIHAGQLTMEIGDPKDYAQIDASVMTGELDLSALGVDKGGLFRSYKRDGPGKYILYAHVGSGEIDLK